MTEEKTFKVSDWKCWSCYDLCSKLIIFSDDDPKRTKLCMLCFVYIRGMEAGRNGRELGSDYVLYEIYLYKAIEKEYKKKEDFTLISFKKISDEFQLSWENYQKRKKNQG